MKKTTLIALVFLVGLFSYLAQVNSQEKNTAINSLNNIPQESIYIHYNTSLLFVGEQFLYKIYCFNDETNTFSTISKIGYIELIAEDRTVVFKHKIRLDTGIGNGDFFIPNNLPTGSYKLFAYTQWMQNKGVESFFEADLAIINPYQKTPKDYLEESTDALVDRETNNDKMLQNTIVLSKDLDKILSLDKIELGKRKKLTITVNSTSFTNGNYSISVRRLNELITTQPELSIDFAERSKNSPKNNRNASQEMFFLPELRGELLSGIMISKDNNIPVTGKKIALSFPGDDFLFKISTTDASGRFYFNLDTPYNNSSVILQQLSEDWENKIIHFDKNQVDYKDIQFKSFHLNPNMKALIEERSIQNQIENAYVSLKLDEKSILKQELPFYREFETIYNLDDYKRFNSIEETVIEIINELSIKKTFDGNRGFYIKPKIGLQDVQLPNLLFVDGVFVKNQESFMDYGAKRIKSISISKDRYLIGSIPFQGILSIETIDGDFYKTLNADYLKKIDLFAPEKNKIYFKQDYSTDTNNKWNRIPDFRRQLLWIPNVTLNDTEIIEMYTSDVTGEYIIRLEGFSSKGVPISVSKTFRVN